MSSEKHPTHSLSASLLTLLFAIFLCITSIFAWVSISNQNKSSLIVNVLDVKSQYQFYVYQDPLHFGHPGDEPSLELEKCLSADDENCYLEVNSPTPNDLIDSKTDLVPSNKFSYALKITNLSNIEVLLKLEFANVVSPDNVIEKNKIQYAFSYEVTKIAYLNEGIEASDIKTNGTINTITGHFGKPTTDRYNFAENIPLAKKGQENSEVIVYFNLHFDENVNGYDDAGNETSSLPFSNQVLMIRKINIYLEKN